MFHLNQPATLVFNFNAWCVLWILALYASTLHSAFCSEIEASVRSLQLFSTQALVRGMEERGYFDLLWGGEGDGKPEEVKNLLKRRVDVFSQSVAKNIVRLSSPPR